VSEFRHYQLSCVAGSDGVYSDVALLFTSARESFSQRNNRLSSARRTVNVTHKYATRVVPGWSGPGVVESGFVHNRTFGDTQPGDIVRHIRQMVFATRN
jgi:hypothetical protein